MIVYTNKNLFDIPAKVLVNPVNCKGVMGKGLALEFKNRYPKMFTYYKTQCDKHWLEPGLLLLHKGDDHWVINFPTKIHWMEKSKLEYIEQGLKTFQETIFKVFWEIDSIAFPQLGCGLGGLNWVDVKPLMEKYLSDIDKTIYISILDKPD